MQAQSARTTVQDPYRAGLQLGEALAELAPEIVFLFSTIGYTDSSELLEGLFDGVENDALIVAGCSGDGFLETGGTSETGAAALGLNSGGKVRWHLNVTRDVASNPAESTRHALEDGINGGEQPKLALLFSDFRLDASEMEKCVEQIAYPVVGGLAADDYSLEKSFVIANKEFLENAMVAVHAFGDLHFDISIGNSLTPIGRPGKIDVAEGKSLQQIDGLRADAFIERETGKPVLSTDVATTSLLIIDEQQQGVRRLRSIASSSLDQGSGLELFGGIENGRLVQVCSARPEELIAEVERISGESRERGFQPTAGLIVSCVGRKGLLGDQLDTEVQTVSRAYGRDIPIAGFPSFGEIGPLRLEDGSYSRNLFHNMTYVLLLVGE